MNPYFVVPPSGEAIVMTCLLDTVVKSGAVPPDQIIFVQAKVLAEESCVKNNVKDCALLANQLDMVKVVTFSVSVVVKTFADSRLSVNTLELDDADATVSE